MREIKFRGQRCEDGKWVYGYVDATMYKDLVVIHSEASTHSVVPETVGQYTGLLDKNNKEIYEGDVVKTKSGWGGIVLWNSRGYFYIKDSSFYKDEEPDLSPIGSLLCCERKQLEITGNIHKKKQDDEKV